VAKKKKTQTKKKTLTNNQYRQAIARLGLNQVEASKFFGVDDKTSPRWCRGDSPVPVAVAKLLKTMIHYEISPQAVEQIE
jgi:hypothetical protein